MTDARLRYLVVAGAAFCLLGCEPEPLQFPPPLPPGKAAVADVQRRLDQYATVKLTADLSVLTDRERQMLVPLVDAAEVMHYVYWLQSFGYDRRILESVQDPALIRLLRYNYGPWDRLADNQPLTTNVGPRPPGGNLYPDGVTLDEVNAMPAAERDNPYSVVQRDAGGKLHAVPYSRAYAIPLEQAAKNLRRAAALCDDAAFKRYLLMRADAFISNDYRASELAWMDSRTSRIDLIIGPIENYEDDLLGVRTAFEGMLVLKDAAWSERLARFATLLPEMQRTLPVPEAYRRETPGTDSELNAYDVLLYTGNANSGAKTIAVNLPNDEAVQLQKGTRRLQLKNAMRAKFDTILTPIARELIATDQQANIRFDAFFANVMFHEVAHGLGVKNTIDGKGTVRAALKELHGAYEEAKADILGLHLVTKLLERKELQDTSVADHYVTFVAGILRSVRFSAADAHGKANMIEFNYFADRGAFRRDPATGRYRVDVARARAATEELAARLLKLQGDGDYGRAKQILETEGVIRPELGADLARLADRNIPVDVVFEQGASVLGLSGQPAAP